MWVVPENAVISLSTWDEKPEAIGNIASAICFWVSSLVPPSAISIAVRLARPGLSPGSAAEPVLNTIRNETSGDLDGLAISRLWALPLAASRHSRIGALLRNLTPPPPPSELQSSCSSPPGTSPLPVEYLEA